MRELPVPSVVTADPDAFDYLRLWMTQDQDHMTALIEVGDAEVWGITLADTGRKLARLLAAKDGSSPESQLDKIEAAFLIEMKAQTPRV